MTIANIKKLVNTESFLQVSFDKGYKYIDTAGEILNLYSKDMKAYNMNPDRLIITEPTDNIAELKISVNDFWCHFINSERYTDSTSKTLAGTYVKNANKVLKITKPAKFFRVGWRNYFIREFNSPIDSLDKLSDLVGGRVSDIGEKIELSNNVDAIIHMKLLKEKKNPEKTAVLLDVDVYIEGDFKQLSDLNAHVETLRQAFLSKEMLSHINSLLGSI